MPWNDRGLLVIFHQVLPFSCSGCQVVKIALLLTCLLAAEGCLGLGRVILAETLTIMLRLFISARISAFGVMV